MKPLNRVVELRPLVNREWLEKELDKRAREEHRRAVAASRRLFVLIILPWVVLVAIYEIATRLL